LQHFKPLLDHPEARALWWPRFLRIADWFAGWDAERRLHLSDIDAEIYGELSIPLGDNRAFILSARADRIEHRTDRTFALVDYKTGQPPTSKQVRLGLSPQLTLEGAILHEGGFKTIANGASIGELLYVRLSGNNPPGEPKTLELKVDREPPQSPDEAAREARRELEKLVRRYDSDNEPYRSVVLSMWSNRYGVYDNLARIKEWAADSGTVDDEP